MFAHPGEIIRALRRYQDSYDPRSTSLMLMGESSPDPHRDPFGPGFIANFEERDELLRRFNTLDERSRRLLILWHVVSVPVTQIARALGVSRVHCYRLHKMAVESLVDDAQGTMATAV